MNDVHVYAVTEADTGRVLALYATPDAAAKTLAARAAQGSDTSRLVVEPRPVFGATRLVLSNLLEGRRG